MAKLSHIISLPPIPEKFNTVDELRNYLIDLSIVLQDTINTIYEVFDGSVEIVNQLSKECADTTPATPDAEFTVIHGLGRVPIYYFYTIDSPGIVYDSRRSEWTTSEIYLKCSVASASVKIIIPL